MKLKSTITEQQRYDDERHIITPVSDHSSKHIRHRDRSEPEVRMVRSGDGGGLRTFSGGLAHENGWFASRKARRLLHWQGVAQKDVITRCEVEYGVKRMATESVRFEFVHDGTKQLYTIDVELIGSDGTITFVEVKRNQNDFKDPQYRAKLKIVRNICEEQKINFRLVFRHQIWESLVHRRNVALFASRGFVTVSLEHLHRMEVHAERVGSNATYGSLAEALEPRSPRAGEAVVQALTVARRVEIDLTRPLLDTTQITIH